MDKRRKNSLIFCILVMMPVATLQMAFASYDAWLTPFSGFIDTMIAFMGIIGKALLAWAIFEVANALFSHDTSQMPQALRRIGGGALLVCAQAIIDAMTSTPSAPPAEVPTAFIGEAISNGINMFLM